MAADRIWTFFEGPGAVGVPVWVEIAGNSRVVAVGRQLVIADEIIYPSSTQVVRVRYQVRPGLSATFTDDEGRTWRVNEVAEVGRRQAWDVSVSTYEFAPVVGPDDRPVPGRSDYRPPVGWNLYWRQPGRTESEPYIEDPTAATPAYRSVHELLVNNVGTVDIFAQPGRWVVFDVVIPWPGWAVLPTPPPYWLGTYPEGQSVGYVDTPFTVMFPMRGGTVGPVACEGWAGDFAEFRAAQAAKLAESYDVGTVFPTQTGVTFAARIHPNQSALHAGYVLPIVEAPEAS